MDFASLFARIGAGFVVRAVAAGFAIYAATEAYGFVRAAFSAANKGFGL